MRQRLIDNPVIALEARALTRAGGFSLAWPEANWRSRLVWGYRTVVVFLCINYYVIHLAASLLPINLIPLQETIPGQALRVWLVIIGGVELFFFLAQTLTSSANAISREHLAGRWDLLRMTGITSQQLLRGKRQAIMKNLRLWMFYITIVRTGMCLSLGYFLGFEWVNYGAGNFLYQPMAIALLLLPVMIYFFTYGLTWLVTAIGLLYSAASPNPGRALISGASSLLLGWVAMSLCAFNTVNQWSLTSQARGEDLDISPICGLIFFSALDNGTQLLSQLNFYFADQAAYPLYLNLVWILSFIVFGSFTTFMFYTVSIGILNRLSKGILEKKGFAPAHNGGA